MFERLPPLIWGCCLLVYWGTVVRKGIRFSRKERHGVHLIPRERSGQWLRVLGMLATAPTRMMLVIVIVHIACLQFDTRREEIHHLGKHGHIYPDYMKHVGRFLPRISSFVIGESPSR